MRSYNYLIVGAGIIGLAIARQLKIDFPDCTVAIVEKEADVARHSSGRKWCLACGLLLFGG